MGVLGVLVAGGEFGVLSFPPVTLVRVRDLRLLGTAVVAANSRELLFALVG